MIDEPGLLTRDRILVLSGLALATLIIAWGALSSRLRTAGGHVASDSPALGAAEDSIGAQVARIHVHGSAQEETFDVELPAVVGHDPSADVVIHDEQAARFHARIVPSLGGRVLVTSLSDDGIYCADRCVSRFRMQPGDTITVGSTKVTLLERAGD